MNRRVFIQSTTGLIAAASIERLEAQTVVLAAVKTVRTNILEIGYHESGDAAGFPVILLHGFPDDAHAYDGVAPVLAKAGAPAKAPAPAKPKPAAKTTAKPAAKKPAAKPAAKRTTKTTTTKSTAKKATAKDSAAAQPAADAEK